METRKYLFETKWKQFLTEQSGTETQVGVSTVSNAEIAGDTIQFTVADLDEETRLYLRDMLAPNIKIVLKNIKLNPSTDKTFKRYTVSSINDISIDSTYGEDWETKAAERLLFYFSQ